MKYGILFFLQSIFLSFFSFGEGSSLGQPIEVEQLDLGSCWVKETASGQIKIASFGFNKNKAFTIDDNLFVTQKLVPNLKSQFLKNKIENLKSSNVEGWIYCTSSGYHFAFEFASSDEKICLVTDMESLEGKGNRFEVFSAANDITVQNQMCNGVWAGEVLLFMKGMEELRAAEQHLKKRYGKDFSKIAFDQGPAVFSIRLFLKDKYHYREDAFVKTLKKDGELGKVVDSIEYNHTIFHTGESRYLFDFSYPGH